MILATLFVNMSTVKCNINFSFGNVVKPIVLATFFFEMSTVNCNINCFFLFEINAKTIVLATLFFGQVVTPMFLARVFSKML